MVSKLVWLVVEPCPPEKYEFENIILHRWKNKKCSKPPTSSRYDVESVKAKQRNMTPRKKNWACTQTLETRFGKGLVFLLQLPSCQCKTSEKINKALKVSTTFRTSKRNQTFFLGDPGIQKSPDDPILVGG